jgi:signal transduction histidine kinase/ActR/RegA family two-component response regulator
MNLSHGPGLDSVFPLYLVLDKENRIKFVSDQLRREIGNSCLGEHFVSGFIVKRPVLAAQMPDIRLLNRQLFLFITHDGDFAMRGQLLPPSPGDDDITMLITPWLTWMQENRLSRPLSPKSFPVADAQLELQLYLNTQQMMIDDMNNLLADLQTATDQAITANKVKSQFVNHISHELRTPLNGIVSAAELIKTEIVNPQVEQLITVIGKSSEALLGIINQILYFSQISSGNVTLALKEFDPAQLCADVLDITRLLAQENNIQIQLQIEHSLPESVTADALRIHNVLLNLVGNAIKHCNGADVLIKVSLNSIPETSKTSLLFEIQDSGPGVPIADRHRIFEPFATLNKPKNNSAPTSGLGLAIVKSEVELMSGHIGITDTPSGKGSLFWFDIPVTVNVTASIPPSQDNSQIRFSGSVLIVDDNEINLRLCMLQLQKWGLHVDAAESAAKAIELARHNQYQLILMDIQMPEMDGQQATRLIRQFPQYRDAPVIAWTANACEIEAKSYVISGFSDTLVKPANNQSFRNMLIKWLPASHG